MAPDVSICIVSWNCRDLLLKCLQSLADKTSRVRYEIIVVDNGSIDNTPASIRELHPECKVIEQTDNLGFGRANNVAVRQASGDYVLFLNPDTELITNAVAGMFDFLETAPVFGAVGCRLTNPDGSIQYPCASTFPTPLNELCDLLFLNRLLRRSRVFSSRELDYWDHQDSRPVDCLSGACMMVRKSLLDELGAFDEQLFMYCEDVDLCYRMRKAGYRSYYLSSETIRHYDGASTEKRSERHFAPLQQRRSIYYFLRKHFGLSTALAYKAVVGVGALSRIFLLALLSVSRRERKKLTAALDRYSRLLFWSLRLFSP